MTVSLYLACAFFILVIAAAYWQPQFVTKHLELYGDFHLELNRSSNAQKGDQPQTQWMNMGYWRDTIEFPQACQALALKTIEAAHIVEGGRVLDVGHGSGDSLLLHISHPAVKRPTTLVGITSARPQQDAAAKRASAALLAQSGAASSGQNRIETKLDLFLGDAVYRSQQTLTSGGSALNKHHPLDPKNPDLPYTSIVAIDCAYHFQTRIEFLQQCFRRLDTGGRIALADMCIVPPAGSGLLASLLTRVIVGALSAPLINFCTPPEYEACLSKMGYTDIHLEDITLDVFPRFVDFLTSKNSRQLGPAWWMMGKVFYLWWRVCGGRYFIVSAKKP